MPTYAYRRSASIHEGMDTCRTHNHEVLPLLEKLVEHDFFTFFGVNLITPCMYFPTEEDPCELDRCEIRASRDRDVPAALRKRDLEEYDFALDGWVRKDMPSDFTEYFDLRECLPRNTGYDGSRVWRFIHNKICFQKRLEDRGFGWKRDFNRYVSGMHAAVDCEILASIGETEEGRIEYRRRLRDEPGSIVNLYFAYMLTLCALRDCRERLNKCGYLGDDDVQPLMRALTGADLLSSEPVQRAAENLRRHATSPNATMWKFRLRTRDLKQIMGCVQCNLCRVHGTVMALGCGATMQVLLGDDGRGGDPLKLDRVQVCGNCKSTSFLGTLAQTPAQIS